MTIKKIGLLGGTFDPIHCGHLHLGALASEEYKLDKVVLIPNAQPPHKSNAAIAPFKHRLAMLSLAIDGYQGAAKFECNDIENILPKPSYTIDTILELQRQYKKGCRLYFMLGADAFLDILTWKSYQQVLQSVHIILSKRLGYDWRVLTDLLKKLGYAAHGKSWHGDHDNKDIFILGRTPPGLSSSVIRTMIEKGGSVDSFLPISVIEYIRKHQLYNASKGSAPCHGH